MKKKLFSAALIVAALFSFSASAQQPVKSAKESTEVTAQTKADKNDKAKKGHRHGDCDKKECDRAPRGDRKGQRPYLFRGITLTAEQQTQLNALRPARPECKDAKCDKAKCEKAECDKSKNDKGGRRHDFKGHRPGAHNPGMRAEYVKKVKEILTPEQYVVFLENIVIPAPQCKGDKACPDANGARTVCPEEGNCPDKVAK